MVTPLAVIPGPLKRQRPQHSGEGLGAAPGEACLGTALAGQVRPLLVGMVELCIELAGDGLPHDLQCHPSGFGLDRLEVVEHASADQGRGFASGLAADIGLKPAKRSFFLGCLDAL